MFVRSLRIQKAGSGVSGLKVAKEISSLLTLQLVFKILNVLIK